MAPAAIRPIGAALTIGVAALFLLCGYEFVRSISTSLYIGAYGAHRLPYVMALSPIGTLGFIYFYGWLLSRMGPRRTLFICSLLAGGGILLCYLGIRADYALAVAILYILREGYIVLLIEQYWSFIDSILSPDQAKRVNGPVCGIASLGAIAGGLAVGQLAGKLGSEALLLFAAFSLLPAGLLSLLAFRLGGEPQPVDQTEQDSRDHLGLGLFRQYRRLVYLAALIGITQVVSTTLDLRFSDLLEAAMPIKDVRTAYLGHFYALLNSAAFVLQFIGAPLLLHFFSLRTIHFFIPSIHVLACGLLVFYPTLYIGAGAYLIFKALDYSVFRAGKELFYIPLPFEARYRSKELIDAFGYRTAKGVTAGLLALAGQAFGRLPGHIYPPLALAALAGWLYMGHQLTRAHTWIDRSSQPNNEGL